jgi:phosphoribosylformylglycinamidine cyclo-ligase
MAIHGMVTGRRATILHSENHIMIPSEVPLFNLCIKEQSTDWKEISGFNQGHRMEIYVPEAVAQDIASKSFHVDAQIVEG